MSVFPSMEPMPQPPVALTIAGSDPSGGAGIQADLKTFAAWNTYGTSVITALTAQNTQQVESSIPVSIDMIEAQCRVISKDITVDAIKIGMLANREIVSVIAKALDFFSGVPVVVDPVMVATSGDKLLQDDAIEALITYIVPKATLITPNLFEASILFGEPISNTEQTCREVAVQLEEKLNCPLILKGSHGRDNTFVDFFCADQSLIELAVRYSDSRNTHGTGCTYSSAIAAGLAHRLPLKDAVLLAKAYINLAITGANNWQIGKGHGPVCHNIFSSRLPELHFSLPNHDGST